MIMRHALTEGGAWNVPDTDRHILPDGAAQAERVARKLLAANLIPDAVWTSHAQRAAETAQVVMNVLNISLEPDILPLLYGEDEDRAVSAICSCDNSINHLLVVAHNPLVSRLVSQLSGSSTFGWFATADVVWLQFDTDDWSQILTSPITGMTKFSSIRN